MPEIIFSGPEGRIEARYHESDVPNAPVALVLHPHPQHGGTMNNKVAYNVYHAFARNGFSVLRFNFRGVGRSQGQYDEGIGELNDAAAALDWLQEHNPTAQTFWMGGFSFGSWIGMQLLMRRPEITGYVAVSPPAGKYDFNFLSPCPAPGLIIQGDKDEIVSETEVSKLAEKLSKQKNNRLDYEVVAGADHFFKEQMDELNSIIDSYLQRRLKEDANKAPTIKTDRRRRQVPENLPL